MNHHPPRFARNVLKLIAGAANIDDLLGDLDEWFYLNLKTKSPFQAKLHYWKQVLSLTFSYALMSRKRNARPGTYAYQAFSIDMLRNYIKIAIRNLYQYKYFSILNAFGLAIGMSVSLLLISVISYVRTYDDFHEHKENIYTITSEYRHGVEEIDYATSPIALADRIEEEFTGAREIARIVKSRNTVKTEKENIPLNCYYVEPDFFNVFTFQVNHSQASALRNPNHVILTRSSALKLFNSVDVIGETIELTDGKVFQVAGVMGDHPRNSHLTFEMLIAYSTLPQSKLSVESRWTDYSHQYVYVLLNDKATSENLQAYLDEVSGQMYAQSDIKVNFKHQQLKDIAMGPDLRQAIGVKWEASGFFLFGIFAALILLPACFNYTNISIARALRRAKEIGLRKTMGGVKSQIFLQFMTETVVIALISLLGAVLIFILIRSEFQSIMVAGSSLDLSLTTRNMFLFLMFALFTGLAAGTFPALHFAGLNPIQALKSKITNKGSSLRVRKVLTIFQFALSFGLILSLVVFGRQYRYSLNFDFGFEKKNRIDVELQDVHPEHFRAAFSQLHEVKNISMSSGLLGVNVSSTWIQEEDKDSTEVNQLFVDAGYISNFDLTLLAGKSFPEGNSPNLRERYIIVNEEFIKAYRIKTPHEALGKVFKVDGNDLEVIGVLKNFHFAPLNQPIGKFFFRMDPSRYVYANLAVASPDALRMFTEMEKLWKQFQTEKKFQARYFEDELNEAYTTYVVLLKLIGFLGLLALTISLLGMLGMVVYTAETKTKEVSIRKVMGATVHNIIYILSKDYLKMMGWAILIAAPITAFLVTTLLSHTQYYRVTLNVGDVILSASILLLFGVGTISTQTYKTAMTNPADTLKAE